MKFLLSKPFTLNELLKEGLVELRSVNHHFKNVMSGNYSDCKELACPLCETGNKPKARVFANIWDSDEVVLASFDEKTFRAISVHMENSRRAEDIYNAQQKFRRIKTILQGRCRRRILTWI